MAKKTNKDPNKNLVETLNEMEVVEEAKKTNKKTVSKTTKTSKKVAEIIQEEVEVKIKKLVENATLPIYAHDGDIGMDIIATSVTYNEEHDYFEYSTGLAAESDRGNAMLLLPRSSVSDTDGYLCNTPGLVDPFTYRGEIKFRYKNRESLESFIFSCAVRTWHRLNWFQRLRTSLDEVMIEVDETVRANIMAFAPYNIGDKIGQMVMVKTPTVKITEVNELSETTRGEGGFGSSGK